MTPIIFLFLTAALLYYFLFIKPSQNRKEVLAKFPKQWKKVLLAKIGFYQNLPEQEKKSFEYRVQEFILNTKFIGIKTEISDTDKLLVASSAIIPIFAFPNWNYSNLQEVYITPNAFNDNFEISGPNRNTLGMVGTGFMDGKMYLSKKALHLGFQNESDKKNTAIHEFVHLIDKMDGDIDGVPSLLLSKQYTLPWIDLIQKKIEDIYENESDINPYGATNKAEFFAVVSEYFFERPKLLKSKHPKLYELMEDIFDQKMDSKELKRSRVEIGRNDPCYCGSKRKFKKCCA